MISFGVAIEGVEGLQDLKNLGPEIHLNAVRAINKIADKQRAKAARLISGQINLPAQYLSPSSGRLTLAKKATRGDPEARIRARGRPTSLARYLVGNPGIGKAGVTVAVKPGQASFMRRVFMIRLPAGKSMDETRFNAGLAIRLRPGERINNKVAQVRMAKNLYLLYGPSVQQVFLNNRGGGVADDISDETAKLVADEFLRLMDL